MSANLQFRTRSTKYSKGSKGSRKRARGSPPRAESGVAYSVFRACGVDVADGSDLKAGLLRVLETDPLALMARVCDPKDMARVRYALRCDRTDALLALYDGMRVSGENRKDHILSWDPGKGGLIQYLKRGCGFAADKLCRVEEQSPWGKTVSMMEEVPDLGEEGRARSLLETLAAKPEPVVNEELEAACTVIAALPEPERLAITWSFGLNDEPRLNKMEIGLKLGCSGWQAWTHYTNAMSKLRSHLLPSGR